MNFDALYGQRDRLDAFDAEAQDASIAVLGCNGFIDRTELDALEGDLRRLVPPALPGALLDLGCGTGGLGQYLGSALGVPAIGIDLSSVALMKGRDTYALFRRRGMVLLRGEFGALPLQTRSVVATVSNDAIYMAPDRIGSVAELARISTPGAPAILTVCEASRAEGAPPAVDAWIRALHRAGFEVLSSRDVSTSWREALRRKHERRCHEGARLVDLLGAARARIVIEVSRSLVGAGGRPALLDRGTRHRLVCQRRKDRS